VRLFRAETLLKGCGDPTTVQERARAIRELSTDECKSVVAGIQGEAVAKTVALSWAGLVGGAAIAGFLGVGTFLTMGAAGAISAAALALTVYHAD